MMSVSALLEIFVVWFQLLTFITLTGLLVSSSNLCTLLASSLLCIITAFPAHVGRDLSTMRALNVIGLTLLRTVGLLIESDTFNSMMRSVGALLQVFRVRFSRSDLITPTDHFLVIFSTLSMIVAISFLSIMDFPIYDGKNLSLVNFSIMISLNLIGLTLLTVIGPLISIIELLMERFTVVDPSLPDWSELPEDLLFEIINRLSTFEDILAASGVSKSWRSASHLITCSNSKRRPLQPPWLMDPEMRSSKIRRIFSLFNRCGYKLLIDEVYERRSWGSPHGWLTTIDRDFETCLVHLLKEVSISLPSLGPIRNLVAGREEWFRLVHRFIPFKERCPELSFLVIAIFGPAKKLAFTRVAFNGGGGAALNRRGEGEWVIVTDQDDFYDVACFQDQLYAICGNGKLVRLELDAPLAADVQDVAPQPCSKEVGTPQQLYLMGSSENLFAVYQYGYYIPSKMRFKTIYFLVYKFNFNAAHWEEVTDLEDAVFVGDCKSWCIPASNIPSRSNCIFFTDSNWEWQRLPGVAYGGRDVGVFNMALRVVQRLNFGRDNPSFYSRSIWITPAIRLDEFYLH